MKMMSVRIIPPRRKTDPKKLQELRSHFVINRSVGWGCAGLHQFLLHSAEHCRAPRLPKVCQTVGALVLNTFTPHVGLSVIFLSKFHPKVFMVGIRTVLFSTSVFLFPSSYFCEPSLWIVSVL